MNMNQYNDIRLDHQLKQASALRQTIPMITTSGTFTDITILDEWDEIWSNFAGSRSIYHLYETTKRYEDFYGEKTESIVEKWEKGTLRRDTKINDWLNTYLILSNYNR